MKLNPFCLMTMASLKCKFKLFRDPLFCGSLLWIKTLGFADVRSHFQLRITGFLNRLFWGGTSRLMLKYVKRQMYVFYWRSRGHARWVSLKGGHEPRKVEKHWCTVNDELRTRPEVGLRRSRVKTDHNRLWMFFCMEVESKFYCYRGSLLCMMAGSWKRR